MIPIKEHNDIIQTLMKELANKEVELKGLIKDKGKPPSQAPQLQPTPNEQMLNKKIAQLTREHKERVGTLSQQLRNKSVENKDLKERLILKQNMEVKEKEHIAQILKKVYDRKPSSGADYKISALVSHYDAEIETKAKFIQSLYKRIRELESRQTVPNQNYKVINTCEERGVSLTEHQRDLNRVKIETQKFKRLFQEKDKQYKNLSRRYSDLTNEYYKIVNSYELEEPRGKPFTPIRSTKNTRGIVKNNYQRPQSNVLENLLHQMVVSETENEEVILNKRNFQSKVARIPAHGQRQCEEQQMSEEEQGNDFTSNNRGDGEAEMKLESILEELSLTDPHDIIPCLVQMKSNIQGYTQADTIVRSLQVFFYNTGKGKLARKDLVGALQDLEVTYNKHLEAVDLLDEVCIEVGARRQQLRGKLMELMDLKLQYYSKLKSIKFTQELAQGNKVVEFIELFGLDREELALPQQLMKIQEQLKAIDKFVREARVILQIGESRSEEVLQLVLRYLQKTSSLVNELQKKKSRHRLQC